MSEEPLRRGQELLQGGVFVFTRSLPAWKVSDVLKHRLAPLLSLQPAVRLTFVAPLLPVRGLARDPGGRVLFCSCAFPSA